MKGLIKQIPNAMTVTRMLVVPYVVWLLHNPDSTSLLIAAYVMFVCELTDMFDGEAARRLAAVSNFGKLVDPLADSLYRSTVFVAFMSVGWMPVWMLLVVLWRDILVAYVRIVCASTGFVMSARSTGKIKAVVQAGAQVLTVLLFYFEREFVDVMDLLFGLQTGDVVFGMLLVSVLYTGYSAIDYLRAGWPAISQALSPPPDSET